MNYELYHTMAKPNLGKSGKESNKFGKTMLGAGLAWAGRARPGRGETTMTMGRLGVRDDGPGALCRRFGYLHMAGTPRSI